MKYVTGNKFLGVVGLAAFALLNPLIAGAATAAPVKLAWSPSMDADVAGYAVYYGPANAAPVRLDVGTSLSAVIPNLTANAPYSFYVVAYNSDQTESMPSNPLQYNPPVLTRVGLTPVSKSVMRVQFRGPVGATCRVQYTKSITSPNWQTLGSATAAADGTISIDDPNAGTVVTRFYRAVYP